MRILLAVAPVDSSKGIDGLAAVCRQVLQEDPFTGQVFIFRNRKAAAIRRLLRMLCGATTEKIEKARRKKPFRKNPQRATAAKRPGTTPPAASRSILNTDITANKKALPGCPARNRAPRRCQPEIFSPCARLPKGHLKSNL